MIVSIYLNKMSTDTLSPMMLFKPALPQAAKSDEQMRVQSAQVEVDID